MPSKIITHVPSGIPPGVSMQFQIPLRIFVLMLSDIFPGVLPNLPEVPLRILTRVLSGIPLVVHSYTPGIHIHLGILSSFFQELFRENIFRSFSRSPPSRTLPKFFSEFHLIVSLGVSWIIHAGTYGNSSGMFFMICCENFTGFF